MQELSFALEPWRLGQRERRADGGSALEEVHVDCGELAGAEPRLLAFAWQAPVLRGPGEARRLAVRWCPTHPVCPPPAESSPGARRPSASRWR